MSAARCLHLNEFTLTVLRLIDFLGLNFTQFKVVLIVTLGF